MDCDAIRDSLADVALGRELPIGATDHIANCRECSVELEQLKATLTLVDRELNAGLAVEAPPGLVARVRESINETAPTGRPVLTWLAGLTAVAVLLVLSARLIVPTTPPSKTALAEPALGEQTPREVLRESSRETTTTPAKVTEPLGVLSSIPATEPEPAVLVVPGQEEAIVAYYGRVSRGEIHAPPLEGNGPLEQIAEAPAVTILALQITPVRIPRIKIEPINVEERR